MNETTKFNCDAVYKKDDSCSSIFIPIQMMKSGFRSQELYGTKSTTIIVCEWDYQISIKEVTYGDENKEVDLKF